MNDAAKKKAGTSQANSSVIVIADKKAPFFNIIFQALTDLGVKSVVDVKNPATAINMLVSPLPTFVLLDWDATPFYQNAEFLQKIRKTDKVRSIPVFFLADTMSEEMIAVAGEYDVEKIYTKAALRANFKVEMVKFFEELDKPPAFKKLLMKLDSLLDKKDQKEIDETVKQLFQMDDGHPRVQIEYASLLVRENKLDEAEKLAERAAKSTQSGPNLRATNLLSRILMRRGRVKDSIELLRNADVLSPSNIERLVLMGDCYFGMGDKSSAKLKYEAAAKIDPNSKEAKKGLGVIELNEGEINKALALFHGSTSEEELAAIFNTAGVIAARECQYERAIQLYETAKKPLRTEELLAKICFNMGLAFRKWNRPTEAEHMFKEAVGLNPKYEKAQKHLSEVQGDLLSEESHPRGPIDASELAPESLEPNVTQTVGAPPATGAGSTSAEETKPKPYAYGAAVFDEKKKKAPKEELEEIPLGSKTSKFMDDEEDL